MIFIPDSIYPKDAAGNSLCPKCKKLVDKCDCPSIEKAQPKQKAIKPSIRLDKSGRKGKVVTLIGALSPNEVMLKNLAKELKSKTGSGGTHYIKEAQGFIELQGDHQDLVMTFFRNACK